MSNSELQEEEHEVLCSIYEGDDRFKELSPVTFQYRIGEETSRKTFLIDVSWGETYPEDLPRISLDSFYNKLISAEVKAHIISQLLEQGSGLVGMAMTYTLFEYAKDNIDDLMPESLLNSSTIQPETSPITESHNMTCIAATVSQRKEKKDQLTKAQKRRQLVQHDDKPRGWNWVDVVKHLRQTGRQLNPDDS